MTGSRTAWTSTGQRWTVWPAAVLVCLLLVVAAVLFAEEEAAGPTIHGAVEQGEWTVGDRIAFTLVLVHPPGLVASLPGVESELGPFQVRDLEDGGRRTLEGGRVEQTWRFWLTAYETGDLEVPPVTVTLTGGTEGALTVSSEPVALQIQTVLEEGEEDVDIADLRPAGEIPYSFVPLVLWFVAGLAALAGLLWLRVWWLARRRREALHDEASRLPPRELAIRELQRLTASDLLKHDRYKEFYITISGIIDRLLHGALGVLTVERTSWEILRDLREQVPGTLLVRTASDFFAACDRVKFSRHVPADAENSGVIAVAYQLVDLATPEPVVQEVGLNQAGAAGDPGKEG